jgi:N-acetylglucosaminylphosphatidylinositol deacetylase
MNVVTMTIMVILIILIFSILVNSASSIEGNNILLQSKLPVLIVIAHPDDEAVFFTPTLLSLEKNKIDTYILCMSNGGGEGSDGDIRIKEMMASAEYAQIPSSNVFISKFNDGHDENWNIFEMIKEIHLIIQEKKIGHVITFDEFGVTKHPNHIACHNAVKQYSLKGSNKQKIRKHYLDTVGGISNTIGPISTLLPVKGDKMYFKSKHFYNTWKQLSNHQSQYTKLWKTYTVFSRYSWLNTYS